MTTDNQEHKEKQDATPDLKKIAYDWLKGRIGETGINLITLVKKRIGSVGIIMTAFLMVCVVGATYSGEIGTTFLGFLGLQS